MAQMGMCRRGIVRAGPVAAACGYSPQVVWKNFGFFTSAGILSSGMNKCISEEGYSLSLALRSGDSREQIIYWRAIIDVWPPMLKLLFWLRKNNGLEIPEIMCGVEALFASDVSSSRFSLNCIFQIARQLRYIQVIDKKVFISDYAERLATSEIQRGSGLPKNLSQKDTTLSEETDQNPAHSVKKEQGGGIHIHLHFGSAINPAQIASIFRSFGEAVLTSPDVATTVANPSHEDTIELLRPNF